MRGFLFGSGWDNSGVVPCEIDYSPFREIMWKLSIVTFTQECGEF